MNKTYIIFKGIGLFIETIILGFTSVPSAANWSSSGRRRGRSDWHVSPRGQYQRDYTFVMKQHQAVRHGAEVEGSQLCGYRKPIELHWNSGGWGTVEGLIVEGGMEEHSFGFDLALVEEEQQCTCPVWERLLGHTGVVTESPAGK